MKRTTYIIIGILVSALVLMAAMITWFMLADNSLQKRKAGIVFSDQQKELELAGIRAVKMFVTQPETNIKTVDVYGDMTVKPLKAGEKARISYPESEFLNVIRKDDTLYIQFDLVRHKVPEKLIDRDWLPFYNVHFNLKVDSTFSSINNEVNSLDMNMRNLKLDSLSIYASHSQLNVDTCHIRAFNVSGDGFRFKGTGSVMRDFYLDMDGMWNCQFSNCTIDTEFLTGSGKHRNNLQPGECKRVVWTPKEEGGELVVTLSEKGTILIQDE